MKEMYFENIENIGNLYLEKIFNKFEDEHITFVCNDNRGNKYFCICYEFRSSLKWLIVPVCPRNLIDLIIKKIYIREIFEKNIDDVINIIYDNNIRYEKIRFDEANRILPEENLYLKPNIEINTYFYNLCINLEDKTTFSSNSFVEYNIRKTTNYNSFENTKEHNLYYDIKSEYNVNMHKANFINIKNAA